MSLLTIIEFPDPFLKTLAEPLQGLNPDIEKLIEDMLETMYQAPGVGLAATQVGCGKSLAVVDASSSEEAPSPIVLINPQIIAMGNEKEKAEEGCLSVPDYRAEVERALKVTLLAKNLKGEDIKLTAEGFLARVIQHELDHLNGRLFIDHIGKLKRSAYVRKRKKELKAKAEE